MHAKWNIKLWDEWFYSGLGQEIVERIGNNVYRTISHADLRIRVSMMKELSVYMFCCSALKSTT